MAYYYAAISQIDHHVGRMIELLKRQGIYDDTLIVYTSDHGDYMGFHHLLLKGNYMYDPVIKVPLIVKLPGQVQAGEASGELVNNIDIAPTLLRAAGCEVPQPMQGRDLAGDEPARSEVFAEGWAGSEYMVRTTAHKLLLCRNPQQSQFFDLVRDPLELDNRIADPACADTIAVLREALAHWALFDARTQTYLDEDAPVISGVNVPTRDDGHVEEMAAYFAERIDRLPVKIKRNGTEIS